MSWKLNKCIIGVVWLVGFKVSGLRVGGICVVGWWVGRLLQVRWSLQWVAGLWRRLMLARMILVVSIAISTACCHFEPSNNLLSLINGQFRIWWSLMVLVNSESPRSSQIEILVLDRFYQLISIWNGRWNFLPFFRFTFSLSIEKSCHFSVDYFPQK